MKTLIVAAALSVLALQAIAAEPAKAPASAPQENNCVKKDKNGKCPPPPKSPKPTPKKKAEKVEKT